MAVVATYCENNKTIRVWQESRGKKTLTRKFYLQYAVNVIVNGKYSRVLYDTLDEALAKRTLWKQNIEKYRGIKHSDWFSKRTALTHIEEYGYIAACRDHYSAEAYITEESGNRISEVIE